MNEMKNELLLSVSMITFKHELYIKQAIEGVLMQETNFEFHLIIADDCSPDATPQIVKDIIDNHPNGYRVKYFRHEKNMGMQTNGSFALQQCKGKYVAVCEGDDYWIDPLKLQKQVDILENNPEYKFCITNLDFYNQSTSKFDRSILNTFKKPLYLDIEDFLVKKAFMAPCTWLGTRECFFLTNINDIQSDGSFAIFMDVLQNTKVYFLDDTTSVYRILQESASHSNSFLKMLNYNQGIYRTQLHYIEKYNLSRLKNIVYESYRDSIKLMLRKNYQNIELSKAIKLIQDDFKSDDIIILVQELIYYYQKELLKINNSKSLRIVKLVTAPLVYIKNKFNV
ncbi:glycosyltransferase family 2 protein [Flavobacterium sp. LB2R40]|uniref:glycosyltransferase family 2 protein n=1 Tax=Flavobacterium sp. LB2R40 TaxID=3401722 RepID=UPI003AAFB48C